MFAENPRFAPRAVAGLGVMELAGLTPDQYEKFIPGTALARAHYDGLRRNAVYALGAARGRRMPGPCWRSSARTASELVRSAAQWALRQLAQ